MIRLVFLVTWVTMVSCPSGASPSARNVRPGAKLNHGLVIPDTNALAPGKATSSGAPALPARGHVGADASLQPTSNTIPLTARKYLRTMTNLLGVDPMMQPCILALCCITVWTYF